jgi:hypothetical protein
MASWGSFAWGFFAGLLLGQVTLMFFLALVRQDDAEEVAEHSSPLAAERETFAPNGVGKARA